MFSYNRIGISTSVPTGPVPQFNLSDHTANQTLGISEQYQYEEASVHVMRNASVRAQSVEAQSLQCAGGKDLCAAEGGHAQGEVAALRETVAAQARRLAALEAVVASLQRL